MRFQASLWDILIGEPTRSTRQHGVSLPELKGMVARDLERLLNTRRFYTDDELAAFPLAARSIFNFGIPDFSAQSLSSGLDRDQICMAMAQAIERHDKRLRGVEVQLRVSQNDAHRLAFDIRAVLMVEGFKDNVNFGAQFDSGGMYYEVNS